MGTVRPVAGGGGARRDESGARPRARSPVIVSTGPLTQVVVDGRGTVGTAFVWRSRGGNRSSPCPAVPQHALAPTGARAHGPRPAPPPPLRAPWQPFGASPRRR